ncbi:hypothetical protein VNO78_16693 [Psophocarpus tetragonolobus]|uniref:Uncharacterized protein n=1 Tax=Psophocarpus tetragonolobus TaxID=3891 RepID=A0AAN9XKA1_PSOTE
MEDEGITPEVKAIAGGSSQPTGSMGGGVELRERRRGARNAKYTDVVDALAGEWQAAVSVGGNTIWCFGVAAAQRSGEEEEEDSTKVTSRGLERRSATPRDERWNRLKERTEKKNWRRCDETTVRQGGVHLQRLV